jgi:hypothetical protein
MKQTIAVEYPWSNFDRLVDKIISDSKQREQERGLLDHSQGPQNISRY